jgi:hypothetical protein
VDLSGLPEGQVLANADTSAGVAGSTITLGNKTYTITQAKTML